MLFVLADEIDNNLKNIEKHLKNIYCHCLSIQYKVICPQNVYKINYYF